MPFKDHSLNERPARDLTGSFPRRRQVLLGPHHNDNQHVHLLLTIPHPTRWYIPLQTAHGPPNPMQSA